MCYLLTHPPHPLCPPLFVTHSCLLPSLLSLCPGGSLDPLSWAGLPTMKNLAISELSSEKSLLFPSDCFKMISSCSKIPDNFHNRRICACWYILVQYYKLPAHTLGHEGAPLLWGRKKSTLKSTILCENTAFRRKITEDRPFPKYHPVYQQN